jgi:hypothetical protein
VPWSVDENQVRIVGAPKVWGPVKVSVLNSTAATMANFHREARLVLMQAHQSSHLRPALAIKSYFRDLAALALASAMADKTAKEERAKDDKATPTWTDHKMEDLLRKTEGAYGLIIFVALTAAHLVAPSCMTTSGVNFCPLPRPAALTRICHTLTSPGLSSLTSSSLATCKWMAHGRWKQRLRCSRARLDATADVSSGRRVAALQGELVSETRLPAASDISYIS